MPLVEWTVIGSIHGENEKGVRENLCSVCPPLSQSSYVRKLHMNRTVNAELSQRPHGASTDLPNWYNPNKHVSALTPTDEHNDTNTTSSFFIGLKWNLFH